MAKYDDLVARNWAFRVSVECERFDFDDEAVKEMFKVAGVDPTQEITRFTMGDLQHALEGMDHDKGVALLQKLNADDIGDAIIPEAMETLKEMLNDD
jgi:hypothetical protein